MYASCLRSITFFLVGLALLGGPTGLMLCLSPKGLSLSAFAAHSDEGAPSRCSEESGDGCSLRLADSCGDCVDLLVKGFDSDKVRAEAARHSFPPPAADRTYTHSVIERKLLPDLQVSGFKRVRGPPALATALLIVETSVIRV